MSINKILNKGDIIVSARSGKELLCYTEPMSVLVGDSIIRYEYYFWDDTKKKTKSYKGHELKVMLEGVWSIKSINQ